MAATPKARIYAQLASVGKALSSPHRLELLEILAQGERTVDAIAGAAALPMANASHHLRVLRQAGLVETRREGLNVHYRLADLDVFELLQRMRLVAEHHLAEVERLVRTYLTARDQLEPISREDLLARVRAGTAVVLDVRPPEEYRAGHIQGARSLPVRDLERRVTDLPADKEVIAYCRGPYCLRAFDAVAFLRAHGRPARRLVDGFPEWRAAGLPVE
ncbi:MAG: metalloregulator ArsR/SmtB family transcription factor [Gemmatimonadetes bacterium]|nr:metalloregulator ArsR/SmtB family transcription factor [Gemmatimonadota bacterium]